MISAAELLTSGRAQAGLTQLEVAVALGVGERTYRRWEHGTQQAKFIDLHAVITQVFHLDFVALYKTVEGKACHK